MGRFYNKHGCPNCDDDNTMWDDDIRSERTGKRILLNEDGTKHYTTCEGNQKWLEQQQQQQQQQQPQPQPQRQQQTNVVPQLQTPQQRREEDKQIASLKNPPFEGVENVSEAQKVINRQLFARLDRIDKSIYKIAEAMARLASYYQRNEMEALKELQYDQDKEDGGGGLTP